MRSATRLGWTAHRIRHPELHPRKVRPAIHRVFFVLASAAGFGRLLALTGSFPFTAAILLLVAIIVTVITDRG